MTEVKAVVTPLSEFRIFVRSACLAIIFELMALELTGWHLHWFAHPQKTKGLDPATFLETQLIQMPAVTHLMSETAEKTVEKKETVISKTPHEGRKATDDEKKSLADPNANETKSATDGLQLGPTHGPVAVYSPAPMIPSYLTNQDLKTAVVIEFLVTAQGTITPRLIGSSDNEELDQIAINSVKKWIFKPAEQDHKAIDSKVRLRIVFEVK